MQYGSEGEQNKMFVCVCVHACAAASGGVGGVRTVIARQHDVILHSVYPHADSGLRNALSEQLVALLDSLLSGYVAQLTSLRRPGQQERYDALEMEYTQRRSELLTPLRKFLSSFHIENTSDNKHVPVVFVCFFFPVIQL